LTGQNISALLVGIVANIIRVAMAIASGYLWGMDHPFVKDHGDLGLIVFLVLIMPLFWLGEALRKEEAAQKDTFSRAAHRGKGQQGDGRRMRSVMIAGAATVALAAPAVGSQLIERTNQQTNVKFVPIAGANGWGGPLPPRDDWQPVFKGADAEGLWTYERAGCHVLLYTAIYAKEHSRQGIN
jgi:hypothetical protein